MDPDVSSPTPEYSRIQNEFNDKQQSLDDSGTELGSFKRIKFREVLRCLGTRGLLRRIRTLDLDDCPPLPTYQCPFLLHGCRLEYSNCDDWFWHSVTHFYTKGSRLACGPAVVTPPTQNRCCFCRKVFINMSGIHSWSERMECVANHHEIGHNLSYARPDFYLLDYFWENQLISETLYRELKENTPVRSRLTHSAPTPPKSYTAGSPSSIPTAEESRPPAVVNERRHNRRASRR